MSESDAVIERVARKTELGRENVREVFAALEAGDELGGGMWVAADFYAKRLKCEELAAEAMREACAAHAAVLIQGFCSAETCTSVYNAILKLKLPE